MSNSTSVPNRSYLRILLALVKPRIIELLLVTAIPALIHASAGWPDWRILSAVVVFGTFAAAGANAWNSIIEREIDAMMSRTKNRPLVTGELSVRHSGFVASVLSISSIVGMYLATNFAAAALTAAAIGFYVLGYTILLKPRTNQNIVWGGIAGCFPVVIAEAAVIGEVSAAGWLMFAIIFFWTPAHYWPLAAHFKEDYSLANIPMLPVERPARIVAAWTLFYTVLTVLFSILFFLVANLGNIFLVIALIFGTIFIGLSANYYRSNRTNEGVGSMRVFHFSITYLAILFLSLAVDILL